MNAQAYDDGAPRRWLLIGRDASRHGDARFALALTRLLVAQTSRLLGRGMQ